MQIDKNSSTWRAIDKWARERIDSRTRTCTTPGNPMDITEQARGALVELDMLLDLAVEKETNTLTYSTDFGG